MVSVTEIYNYYKKFGHKTEVMGASFRNLGEITELAGCDLLTIAPNLLAELRRRRARSPRKLDPRRRATMDIAKIDDGRGDLPQDARGRRMAKREARRGHRRLLQGDRRAREAARRAATRACSEGRAGAAAHEFFKVYDLDGDGFITREEWAGSPAVFAALDLERRRQASRPKRWPPASAAAFVLAEGDGTPLYSTCDLEPLEIAHPLGDGIQLSRLQTRRELDSAPRATKATTILQAKV